MAKLQIKNENLAPFGGFFRVIGIFSAKPAPATVSYLKVTAFENTTPLTLPSHSPLFKTFRYYLRQYKKIFTIFALS